MPNAHDTILLMHETGLDKKTVNAWFSNKRTNMTEIFDTAKQLPFVASHFASLPSSLDIHLPDQSLLFFTLHRTYLTPRDPPRVIWKAYERDPEGYVASIKESRRLEDEQNQQAYLAYQDERRQLEMLRMRNPEVAARMVQREQEEYERAVVERERERVQRLKDMEDSRRGMTREYDEMRRRVAAGFRGQRTYTYGD